MWKVDEHSNSHCELEGWRITQTPSHSDSGNKFEVFARDLSSNEYVMGWDGEGFRIEVDNRVTEVPFNVMAEFVRVVQDLKTKNDERGLLSAKPA